MTTMSVFARTEQQKLEAQKQEELLRPITHTGRLFVIVGAGLTLIVAWFLWRARRKSTAEPGDLRSDV